MTASDAPGHIKPRIIIHGGAGNISPTNLPPPLYEAHRQALLKILSSTATLLEDPKTTALDAACHAVTLLELNPLYNAGRGAVFTTAGRIEHEASVMVSSPHPLGPREHAAATASSSSGGLSRLDLRKRACSSIHTSRVKHPILLAREILVRGGMEDGGGAGGHNQLSGIEVEGLAKEWGLEMRPPSWFWERKRWDQHRRGLGLSDDTETFEREKRKADEEAGCDGTELHYEPLAEDAGICAGAEGIERLHDEKARAVDGCAYCEEAPGKTWNGKDYLPQGTVGAVVLDRFGTICAATSTGGMTNKLPGRVGDTPTIGAGFWAESWQDHGPPKLVPQPSSPLSHVIRGDWKSFCRAILPSWLVGTNTNSAYLPITEAEKGSQKSSHVRAVGMSGTGNGDSFLRICAARTVAAVVRFSPPEQHVSLQRALSGVAGPDGALQASAEDRWGKTGEGEGGIIGIELVNGQGKIVSDHNCGGMFRTWIDDDGKKRMMAFSYEYGTL